MKSILKVTIIILVILSLLTQGLTIFISNTSAADSITATKLTGNIDKIQENNIDLESQILSLSSFQTIASRAADLGYKNTSEFISVYDPMPIALNR